MTETTIDPLTPIDCDLSDFKFMPLEVSRLRKSKAWLLARRNPAIGFYMMNLWAESWHQRPAASLEDDDDVLSDLAMCDPVKWKKVREDVLRGWLKCSDGRLYHPVVAEKAREAWKAKQAQRDRTEAARIARDVKRQRSLSTHPTTYVTDSVTDNVTDTVTTSVTDTVTTNVTSSKGEGQGEGEGNTPQPPFRGGGGGSDVDRAFADAGIVDPAWPPPDRDSSFAAVVLEFGIAESLGPKQRSQLDAMLKMAGADVVRTALREAFGAGATDPISYIVPQVNRAHAKRIQAAKPSLPPVRAFVDSGRAPTGPSPLARLKAKQGGAA